MRYVILLLLISSCSYKIGVNTPDIWRVTQINNDSTFDCVCIEKKLYCYNMPYKEKPCKGDTLKIVDMKRKIYIRKISNENY